MRNNFETRTVMKLSLVFILLLNTFAISQTPDPTGIVIDCDTGLPLKAGIILINLPSDTRRDNIVDGKFRELVLPIRPWDVLVQVALSDSTIWSHFEAKLSLQPGEERKLDIRLFKNQLN
jgi:hypothetical protein